ncbi:hypothetical protein Aperf_G00000108982 [Anoplocephala perfoliata]
MALVDYGDSDSYDSNTDNESIEGNISKSQTSKSLDFHDKVEDEYKMRMPKNAKPLLQPLAIQRKTGLNGKVIPSIPTLEDLNSSDDSDDDKPKKVQESDILSNKSKSAKSLLDLLPPTRSLIVREGDKPVLSSHLIPRQAVRKPPLLKPLASKTSETAVESNDEDFDNESTSTAGFFTFDASQKSSTNPISTEEVRQNARVSVLASKAAVEATVAQKPSSTSAENLPSLKEKPFKDWELQKRPDIQRGDSDDEFEKETESMFTAESFIPGPERKKARLARSGISGPSSVPDLLAVVPEGAQIREVRAEDLTAGADLELIKDVTKSRPVIDPQQHIVNNPGKLAFRKHQITWLAYKAQEDEYELQEQWAEARRNKTISRQKYGF